MRSLVESELSVVAGGDCSDGGAVCGSDGGAPGGGMCPGGFDNGSMCVGTGGVSMSVATFSRGDTFGFSVSIGNQFANFTNSVDLEGNIGSVVTVNGQEYGYCIGGLP